MLYIRAIPEMMRTDEAYAAAFGSIIFINIGFTPVKRAAGDSSAAAEEGGDNG